MVCTTVLVVSARGVSHPANWLKIVGVTEIGLQPLQIWRVASAVESVVRSGWVMECPAISLPSAAMACRSAWVKWSGVSMVPEFV